MMRGIGTMKLKFIGSGTDMLWEKGLIPGKVYEMKDFFIQDELGSRVHINKYRINYFEVVQREIGIEGLDRLNS